MRNLVTLKFKIKEYLTNFLYKPVEQRHRIDIETLILQNCKLMNTSVRAFRYKGVLYRSSIAPQGPLLSPGLHPDLMPHLAQIQEEQARIYCEEQPTVQGYITKVMNLTSNVQDYKLLLPSCVHSSFAFADEYAYLCTTPVFTSQEAYDSFLEQHAPQVQLIKERMTTNLLFQI